MSTARTTRSFKTGGGTDVVLFDYITGREAQEIAALASQKVEGKSEYDMQITANNAAIAKFIVSLNGKRQGDPVEGAEKPFDIVTAVLDLPLAEFSEVSQAVSDLINPKKK